MSRCVSCEQKDQQLAEKDQQIAELSARVKQLEADSAAAFDPNQKFVELSAPFDDLHIGQVDEEEIEQELANQLPTFETLFKTDNISSRLQGKHKIRYDAFSTFKKRLFWYFWRQYETMIESQPAAKSHFSKISRAVALRAVCDLADIDNEPTGPEDCWLANSKLVNEEGRARFGFDSKTITNSKPYAHRFAGWLKFGFTALTCDNKNEASHLCNNPICLRHVFPEQGAVNKSRIPCHRSGCAIDCEHEPKCQYQSNGVYLPCRSNPELEECICVLECFDGVMRKIEVTEEPDKKKREINFDGWIPVGPVALTVGMLEQNVARPRLWFNQRRYRFKKVNRDGSTYYCCFREKTQSCTGTAKISNGQVHEMRPHCSNCALVTTYPF